MNFPLLLMQGAPSHSCGLSPFAAKETSSLFMHLGLAGELSPRRMEECTEIVKVVLSSRYCMAAVAV